MAWLDKFKGHEGSSGDYGQANTIDDDEWRELQKRAQRNAPAFGSREATERTFKARDNYDNREQC